MGEGGLLVEAGGRTASSECEGLSKAGSVSWSERKGLLTDEGRDEVGRENSAPARISLRTADPPGRGRTICAGYRATDPPLFTASPSTLPVPSSELQDRRLSS